MRKFVGLLLIVLLCVIVIVGRYVRSEEPITPTTFTESSSSTAIVEEEVAEESSIAIAIATIPEPESLEPPTEVEVEAESEIVETSMVTIYTFEQEELEPEPELEIEQKPEKVEEETLDDYSAAAQIWSYLHDVCGFNDAVCAGILGNIMAETGGQTLYIQWWLGGYDTGYYGMCQWALCYCPEVYGRDLAGQCEYLASTMEYNINSFGFCYYSGFDYATFLSMTNPSDVALAFAQTYERCSSASYYIRQVNAQVAYDYFCN